MLNETYGNNELRYGNQNIINKRAFKELYEHRHHSSSN
jgi:hypothetical protein